MVFDLKGHTKIQDSGILLVAFLCPVSATLCDDRFSSTTYAKALLEFIFDAPCISTDSALTVVCLQQ